MSRDRFPNVQRLVREHPWAILPVAFDAMLEVVERRIAGAHLSEEEIAARLEAARPKRAQAPAAPGSIAVLPIHGILSHRMGMMVDISGGTSAEAVGAQIEAVVSDPSIAAVVLDVDSPGGSVFGIEELGNQIHAARGTKPIVAVANALAASAAYWVASQADELVVTPSGEVGSIGVLAVHDDFSGYLDKAGVKRTYVTAGRFKAEGNETEPLGDDARAHLQAVVDDYYGDFVRAVARGRGVSMSKVRSEFGEGRLVGAERAVALGMADREGTLQETIERLAMKVRRSGARAEDEGPSIDVERERMKLRLAAGA